MTAAKEHRFELVDVPEEFGPRTVLVDEARVKAFAYAQDDWNPWHFGESPFGGPVAHPSLLANELMQIYFERYRIDVHEAGAGADDAWLEEAHVEETLWFEAPLAVGETATLRGRFVDKYVVNDRGAVVLEGEATADDGRVVLRHRAVEYFRMDGATADDGRREPPLRRVDREAAGERLPTIEKRLDFPQLLVYSALDHRTAQRSIHTDYEIAARAGLQAPLVQGQQLASHLAEALEVHLGAAWYERGMVRIKFLGAVCAGQTIRVEGVVRGETGAVEIDAWIDDEAGAGVAVANCALREPAKRSYR